MNMQKRKSEQPQVIILGAGASLAAFPNGDKNGRLLPLMNNFIDVLKLEPILVQHGIDYKNENFEALYDALASNNSHIDLVSQIEKEVFSYFSGMKIPLETDKPTLYDYLLLSLRKKDVIATFNWDPFLPQAYLRNYKIVGDILPNILFLHGNVAIGVCTNCQTQGFMDYGTSCWVCCNRFEQSKLLYPVMNKNYKEDRFIANQWEQMQNYLNEAYMLTIFGYSAPVTDEAAKSFMKQAWDSNRLLELSTINIVDIRSKKELMKAWQSFSPYHFNEYKFYTSSSIKETYLFHHPRRSCEAFQMATLQQDPWPENKYPEFKTLKELHEWIKSLIEEEKDNAKLSSFGFR